MDGRSALPLPSSFGGVELIAALVLAFLVVAFVVAPLRRPAKFQRRDEERRRDELEAAKEAKYREIRDAELDFRMGKLSEQDWRRTDRELRAEAIAILRELDSLT